MTSDILTFATLLVLLVILLVCGTLATRPSAPDSEHERYEAAAVAAMEDHGGALSPGMTTARLPEPTAEQTATDRATVAAVMAEREALDREGLLLVACDLAIEYQVARDGLFAVALRSKLN